MTQPQSHHLSYVDLGIAYGKSNAERFHRECSDVSEKSRAEWWENYNLRITSELDVMLAAGISVVDCLAFSKASWVSLTEATR